MSRTLFFTTGALFSQRWTDAFPGAHIVNTEDGSENTQSVDNGDLCWVVTQTPDWMGRITALAKQGARVVALSRQESTDETLQALNAGCHGYTHVLAETATLQSVAATVISGGFWVGPEFMQALIRSSAQLSYKASQRVASLHTLTTRESEVAMLVAGGLSNKAVAQQLDVTERTIKAHLSAIYEKLGVHDRLQLALLVNSQRSSTREQ